MWWLIAIDGWQTRIRVVLWVGAMTTFGVLWLGIGPWREWLQHLTNYAQADYLLTRSNVSFTSFAAWLNLPAWIAPACGLALVGIAWALHSRVTMAARWLLWGLVAILTAPIGWAYYFLVLWGPALAWSQALPRPLAVGVGMAFLPHAALVPGWWHRSLAAGSALLVAYRSVTVRRRPGEHDVAPT